MYITEIFTSIQGEGTRAGLPCIFVRLTGCNLRCTWCDTAYAFHGGKKMSVEDVVGQVDVLSKGQGWQGRCASGGIDRRRTPVAGRNLSACRATAGAGYSVMIETSGERFIGRLPKQVIKIVDVKCPDSGEPDTFDIRNLDELTLDDEVKFVISTRRDYEFAREFIRDNSSRAG